MSAPHEEKRIGRGVFLATVAGGIGSLAFGKSVWSHFSGAVSPIASTLAPFLPKGGWRIYTVTGSIPAFDRSTWRLNVGGLVDHPMTISYDELRAMPRVNQISTFHCVTGWTVKNVHWGGVRLSDLMERVGPTSYAGAMQFLSAETPYIDYLSLPQARLHDVMLAYEMNGEPLRPEHGAPVRLVIPDMYGYKNVKWLKGINLVHEAGIGYWEALGYDKDAWVGRSNGYT
jgi:DMSO/TMAO reductase YedYZ molybdopterin-dependent catalytic subunit